MAPCTYALVSLGLLIFVQKVSSQNSTVVPIGDTTTTPSPCAPDFILSNSKCFKMIPNVAYLDGATQCENLVPSFSYVYYAKTKATFSADIVGNTVVTGQTGVWYGIIYTRADQSYIYDIDSIQVATGDYNDPAAVNSTTWSGGAPNPGGVNITTSTDNSTLCVKMSADSSGSDGFRFTVVSCDSSTGSILCVAGVGQYPASTSTTTQIAVQFVKTTTTESMEDYVLHSFRNAASSKVKLELMTSVLMVLFVIKLIA